MEQYKNLRQQMFENLFKNFKLPRIKRPTSREQLEQSLRSLRTPDRELRDFAFLFGYNLQMARNEKERKSRPKVNWQKEGF